MALKDFCRTAPVKDPKTCTDVTLNWAKVSDMYDVLCCFMQKEFVTTERCVTYAISASQSVFAIPPEWSATSTEKCDYDVHWNGLKLAYSGEGTGEFEWSIMNAGGVLSIMLTDAIGTQNTPETLSITYREKKTGFDLLDCDTAITSC